MGKEERQRGKGDDDLCIDLSAFFFDFVVTSENPPGILSSLSVCSFAILCASGDSPH